MIPEPLAPTTPIMVPRQRSLAIIESVARHWSLSTAALVGAGSTRPLPTVRAVAMRAVARAAPHLSTMQIGRLFRRDHSTVVRAMGRLVYQDPAKQEIYLRFMAGVLAAEKELQAP